MSKIPTPKNTTIGEIDRYHEFKANDEKPRFHLGASGIGKKCERELWYGFRKAFKNLFPGRILRLFRRGHHEEHWVVQDLRSIGCVISGALDDQMDLELAPHFGGSPDGVIHSGVPEAPKTPHVLEIKTHSLKSFQDLQKQGVAKSKPVHVAQMQCYMHGLNIKRALYVAVCKNDDQLYIERIEYDKKMAEDLIEKAKRIIKADRIPDPISTDPSWWECKFCPARDLCHGKQPTDQINCRTCAHSTPEDDGRWHCAKWDNKIPRKTELVGCDSHVLHPDLVPWKLVGGDGVRAEYEINGETVVNGEGATPSREMV